MRIAVYHNLPSGGGKRALYEMTRRLAVQHTVDVYTLSCAEHDFCDLRQFTNQHVVLPFEPLPILRTPFGRINQLIRTLDLIRVRAVQQQVASQIDASQYDVVFAHNCQLGQSPSVLSFLRTPSVYYCGEPPRLVYEPAVPRFYNRQNRWRQFINRLDLLPQIYRQVLIRLDRANVLAADLILVNSAYSRESFYRTYGIFAHIGYLGVDTELFHPIDVAKSDFVLSVGSINPNKGFDFLIQSLALLPSAQRPPLIVVGNSCETREYAYLNTLAAQSSVTVEFRHMVKEEELVRLYNQAKVVVYAPVMEPFGFASLEAMACGAPVVAIAEGGVRETIVDESTGLLVDRDPAEFANALRRLLTNPGLAAEYGRNGRQHVLQNWRWEAQVAKLEKHLAACAESR